MANTPRFYFFFYKPFLLLLSFVFFVILTFPTVLFAANGLDLDPAVVARARQIGDVVRRGQASHLKPPTCFIVHTHEDENQWSKINYLFHLMGIKTTLDVNGDCRGLAYGAPIDDFMTGGVRNSNFVLCLLTPNGLARSHDEKSGFATELGHIHRRIEQEGSTNFLLPVLVAGDEHTSVPEVLRGRGLHFFNAINSTTGKFDLITFCRVMWPLFGERIFIRHPWFSIYIQPLL